MSFMRKTYELAQSFVYALNRRAQVAFTGRSRVAFSCQIPNLRNHYSSMGLSEASGIFVEIGGFDGESFSNTSFLADQGWRGLYVEPIPHHVRRIKMRHALNNVSVEQVALAQSVGHAEMAVMGPLSTAHRATEDAYDVIKWSQQLASTKNRSVFKTNTLEKVLSRHDIPTYFELMVIDIEGGEEEIIDDLLRSDWRPISIIVELIDFHPDFIDKIDLISSHQETRRKLKESGYKEVFVDMINTIFVRGKD